MNWVFDDGGRSESGFKGKTGDCVCRAITIATGKPYSEVYAEINSESSKEKPRQGKKRSSARTGVFKATMRRYMESLGWRWVPTMQVGQGCKVHLLAAELPSGRLVVNCSRHLVAVIDGVVHDTSDPTRDGTRCVYGYWRKEP